MKKLFSLGIVVMVSFAACKKNNVNVKQQANNQPLMQTMAYNVNDLLIPASASPANPDNPYDNFGMMHNQICIHTQDVWEQSGFSETDTQDLHTLYAAEVQVLNVPIDSLPSFSEFLTFQNDITADSAMSYVDFINQSNLSTLAKNYAVQLYRKYDSMALFNSFTSYIASYVTLENQIENDNNLVSSEKAMLLRSASVFRYSSVLWVNVLYDDLGGATGHGLSPMSRVGNWWHAVVHFVKTHANQLEAAGWADYEASGKATGSTLQQILQVAAASAKAYAQAS